MALEAKHHPVNEYTDALTRYERLSDQIEEYLEAKGLDAIVFGGAEWQGIWAICFANGRLPVVSACLSDCLRLEIMPHFMANIT
jgi:hypothetical protein